MIMDRALRFVQVVTTDGSGNYSLPLALGTYNIFAQLSAPSGNEVAPNTNSFAFTTDATIDMDFSTGASQALTGTVELNGTAAEIPVLVYVAGTPPEPIAWIRPAPDGSWSVNLADGTYDVQLSPESLPNGVVSAEPVSITVGGGTITGTDVDGLNIGGNDLPLDPFGSSEQGMVRSAVSDFFQAQIDGDATALTAALHANTLHQGHDKTSLVTELSGDANFGDADARFDHMVGYFSVDSASTTDTLWVKLGREFSVSTASTAIIDFVDARDNDDPQWKFTVRSDDGGSTWLCSGNDMQVLEIFLGHDVLNTQDAAGADTESAEIELGVEENTGVTDLVSVSVAGNDINTGTLTEVNSLWAGFIDNGGTEGPGAFDANFPFVEDDVYTFTVDSGSQTTPTMKYNAPVASLYPTVTLVQTSDLGLRVTWNDLSAQLNHGFGTTDVIVVEDPSGAATTVASRDGAPAGANWLDVDSATLVAGTDYYVEVQVADTGGASQSYKLEFSWPLDGIVVGGTIADGSAAALSGVSIIARDATTFTTVQTAVSDGSGDYELILDVGTYELTLEDIPANSVPPAPVFVDVIDNAGTLEIHVDSVQVAMVDFTVETPLAQLTGDLLVDTVATDGLIRVFDGTDEIQAVSTTAGAFDLLLNAGTFSIIAEPFAVSPGVITPAPYTVTVTDTGSLQQLTHDFEFVTPNASTPGTTVYGTILSDGAPYSATVRFTDSSGNVMALVHTSGTGDFSITLAPGDYAATVTTSTLPAGFTGTSSSSLTVNEDGYVGQLVFDDTLIFLLNTTGTAVSGTVTDPGASPVQGVVLQFLPFDPMLTPGVAISAANGTYSILLADGDYEVVIDPTSLPAGVVTPSVAEVMLAGSPVTHDVALTAADATISGTVSLDAAGAEAEIAVLDSVGELVSFVQTAADGTFSIGLVDGDYVVNAQILNANLGTVITPDPVTITVAGSNLTGIDFDFVSTGSGTAELLTGRLIQAGASVPGEVQVFKDVGGIDLPFASVETSPLGADNLFQIALTTGSYLVEPVRVNGLPYEGDPIELVVQSGAIFADGELLAGNQLEIDLGGGRVDGFVRDTSGLPLSGVELRLLPLDSGGSFIGMTDPDGFFAINVPEDGEYWLKVDENSLPTGQAAPRMRRIHVSQQAVNVFPSFVELGLVPAAGTLSGQVTSDSSGRSANVYVVDAAGRFVSTVSTDSTGNYSVRLAAGEYSVFAMLNPEISAAVPPIISALTFSGDATQNIAFDTTTASQTLTGNATIGGDVVDSRVLVTTTADPIEVVAWQPADPTTGDYSLVLPAGNYRVSLSPESLPSGVVSAAAVAITVGGSITGTDIDGVAISGNVLNLDPHAATIPGATRELVSQVLQARSDGDTAGVTALLHSTLLHNGHTAAQLINHWSTEDDFGDPALRWDSLVAS